MLRACIILISHFVTDFDRCLKASFLGNMIILNFLVIKGACLLDKLHFHSWLLTDNSASLRPHSTLVIARAGVLFHLGRGRRLDFDHSFTVDLIDGGCTLLN